MIRITKKFDTDKECLTCGEEILLDFAHDLKMAVDDCLSREVFLWYRNAYFGSDETSMSLYVIQGRNRLFDVWFGRKLVRSRIVVRDSTLLSFDIKTYVSDPGLSANLEDVIATFSREYSLKPYVENGLTVYKKEYKVIDFPSSR